MRPAEVRAVRLMGRGERGGRPQRVGDRIAITAYLGSSDKFDNAIRRFAETYADQNEADYPALQEAVASAGPKRKPDSDRCRIFLVAIHPKTEASASREGGIHPKGEQGKAAGTWTKS